MAPDSHRIRYQERRVPPGFPRVRQTLSIFQLSVKEKMGLGDREEVVHGKGACDDS